MGDLHSGTAAFFRVRLRWGGLMAIAAWLLLGGGCKQQPRVTPVPYTSPLAQGSADQPIFNLTSPPVTRPAPPPEPKIIDEGEKSTLIYTCRHARPDTLKEVVGGLIGPEGSVQASAALNTLVISDKKEAVKMLVEVLREVDRPSAQLLVEARVVEVTLDSDLETEIQHALMVASPSSFVQNSSITLKTPGATPNDSQGSLINIRPWSSDGKQLNEFVRLLLTRGKARILSSPNLLVSAGSESSIITGEEVPIQSTQTVAGTVTATTQFKRVGIKLRVSLQQITSDTARLEINPEVSAVTGYTSPGNQGISNPIVAIRNVTSTLAMKDGEILTVGGLLRDEDRQITRGIPLLMDIPVLGLLFQSQRNTSVKTQLIFFMRIHILPEGKAGTTRIYRPGSAMDLLEQKAGLQFPQTQPAPPPPPEVN